MTNRKITNPRASFGQAKGKQGIGACFILKFLNNGKKEGIWKQWMIQEALEAITSKDKEMKRMNKNSYILFDDWNKEQ